jgi:selenocysteine-specific translation elongation factor
VPIDHFFNVKGIGSVVLGCVFNGTIRSHDNLRVHPGEKSGIVRSIQKHDDNYPSAGYGERVGLALKNIDTKDLDRGFVLSNDDRLMSSDNFTAKAELNKYWPKPIEEGKVLHLGNWLQFIPGRVLSIDNADDFRSPAITIELEKKLVYMPGTNAVITHLEGGKLRVAGTLNLD